MPLFDQPNNLPLNTPPEDMFAKPTASAGSAPPPLPPLSRPPVPPPPPPAPGMARAMPRPAEPEDIFSKTAPLGRSGGMIPSSPNPMGSITESPALGLGRKLTRLIFFAIGAVLIVGGGYALYIYVVAPALGNKPPVNANLNVPAINQNVNTNTNVPPNGNANANVNVPPLGNLNLNGNTNANGNLNSNTNGNANLNANQPVLAPQDDPNSTVDSDGDGLTDYQEVHIYHTDPNQADTDHDGLSDRDEVVTWKTDPLNPDTDGDGYTDGSEVKNGYNPLGSGKLLPPVTK